MVAGMSTYAVPAVKDVRPVTSGNARILIHSHNDYAQKRPFWGAYEAGADSIEADVFLVDGKLLVAHSRRDLKPENTLRRLYLEPLREVFKKNGGRARANGKPLQLLVDLKNGKPAFDALLALIERDGFRDCFDIGKNPAAARLTITGDNSGIDFSACPAFVFFDVPSNRKLDDGQYKRVWLVSDYAGIYTKWRSGEMQKEDKRKIRDAAAQAHAKGVLFRLWGFPDHPDAWRLSLELGLDFINTDRPAVASKALAAFAAPAPAKARANVVRDWENIDVNSFNRMPAATYAMPLVNENAALTDALEFETP